MKISKNIYFFYKVRNNNILIGGQDFVKKWMARVQIDGSIFQQEAQNIAKVVSSILM